MVSLQQKIHTLLLKLAKDVKSGEYGEDNDFNIIMFENDIEQDILAVETV